MPTSGTYSNEETIRAWAEITLNMWRERIIQLNVWDTQELFKSLKATFDQASGGEISKVEFSFFLYGIFVDMGVGREMSKEKMGDAGNTFERKPREWYSRVFYREVMQLRRILAEKYADTSTKTVISVLEAPK